jgi:5-(carboxyamino)imidazole ribonucleotide synthase
MKVGILGGGQLGRMLALAGYPLGLRFRFLDNDSAPAGQLAELITGEFEDEAILEAFARDLDVVTYEFENVPVGAVRWLARAGVPCYPPPEALEAAQDRLHEKMLFTRLGIPTPAFMPVDSEEQLAAAVEAVGLPAVLKTRRLGYDGKGQVVIRDSAEIVAAWAQLGGRALILEAFIPFERELSIIAVRNRDGQTAYYPLIQNEHREGILRMSLAPAPGATAALQATAEDLVRRIVDAVDYVGVLALELFQVKANLLASEVAPRVHNSGHWTIEGAVCSQFENHLRGVLGWPLGSTAVRGHSVMFNLIGEAPPRERVLRIPGAHLHLYGKTPRPGRKIGHVTVCCPALEQRDLVAAELRGLA